jgi:hypothetical protein
MKLSQPMALSTIQTLRGTADFYTWKGLNVVRKWPRKPHQPNSPEQLAVRDAMRQLPVQWEAAPAAWHTFWKEYDPPPTKNRPDMRRSYLIWCTRNGIDPLFITPVAVETFSLPLNGLYTTVIFTLWDTTPQELAQMKIVINLYESQKSAYSYITAITGRTTRQGVPCRDYTYIQQNEITPVLIENLYLPSGLILWTTEPVGNHFIIWLYQER